MVGNSTELNNCINQSELDHRYWPNTCFKDEFSHLNLTDLENIIGRYVFPVQFVIGVIGNSLNLLCFKGMRSKTNRFLSYMAMSDLFFLLCSFPTKLVSYDIFNSSKDYVQFFYRSHPTFIALVNWFSATSIWLTVGVTIERVVAVKCPLHARSILKRRRVTTAIVAIYIVGLIVSAFHIALRKVAKGPICGQCDQMTYRWEPPTADTGLIRLYYVRISLALYSLLVVFLPLIVIILLNTILIHYLRRHRLTSDKINKGEYQQTNVMKQRLAERKVTVTVVVIIVTFVILNLPSAVIYIVEMAKGIRRIETGTFYANTITVSNAMVTTGKATNFLLFCLSSESFRKRLGILIVARATRSFTNLSEGNLAINFKRNSTHKAPVSPAVLQKMLEVSSDSTEEKLQHMVADSSL